MKKLLLLAVLSLLGFVSRGMEERGQSDPHQLYNILGLSFNASIDDIKKSYRVRALQYHPDKNQGDNTALAQFQQLETAYKILLDPITRNLYDTEGLSPAQINTRLDPNTSPEAQIKLAKAMTLYLSVAFNNLKHVVMANKEGILISPLTKLPIQSNTQFIPELINLEKTTNHWPAHFCSFMTTSRTTVTVTVPQGTYLCSHIPPNLPDEQKRKLENSPNFIKEVLKEVTISESITHREITPLGSWCSLLGMFALAGTALYFLSKVTQEIPNIITKVPISH